MFCNHCGATVGPDQAVCAGCGRSPLRNNVAVAVHSRVSQHLHLLAILWLVVGVMLLIPVPVFLALAGVSGVVHFQGFPPIMNLAWPSLFTGLAIMVGVFAFANLLTGWGLLKVRPWGRILALIMGCFALFHPPIGTALGIYTLYVLLSSESGAEYERMAAGAEAAQAARA